MQCKMSDSSLVLWDTTGNTPSILLPLPDCYINLPSEVVSFDGHKSVSMHLMSSNRDYCLPPYNHFQTLEKPFILDADACQNGIGAVLSQDHDGEEKVVPTGVAHLVKLRESTA